MTDIRVIDLIGPLCIDLDGGAKLCEQAQVALSRGETVCLDFTGITTLAGAFLSTAVGRLHAFFDKDDLDRRLLWKGLDSTDEGVLRIVRRNAIQFYSANQPKQEALLLASARAAGQ